MPQDAAKRTRPNALTALAAVIAAALALWFVAVALIGASRWAHPIPYWDMWDGYLSFWFELQDGNTAIWWELSNEHHLVLLKAIFWLDLTIFSGSQAFLVAVNMLLVGLTALTLIFLLRARIRESTNVGALSPAFILMASVMVVITFAWMQGVDLVFPYHAQFLMNNVIPLATFLFLGLARLRYLDDPQSGKVLYGLGIVGAIASPWTSASGLLVPFIAAGLVWTIGWGAKRALVLIALGIVSFLIYSIDSPFVGSGEGGALSNLVSEPVDVALFWFVYLGRPWSHITGQEWIGSIAGVSFVLITVGYVLTELRRTNRSITGLMSISFPVFVLAAAAITAAGRVSFGMEQVFAVRYLTPMLIGWAALLIVAAPSLASWIKQPALMSALALLLIPAILIPEQASALSTPHQKMHDRDVALLAVALNAPDATAIQSVYPISAERPLELGQRAMEEEVAVFAQEPYPRLQSQVGSPGPFVAASTCAGWIDSRTPLENSSWDRVDGWVYAQDHAPVSGVVELTDDQRGIVGFVHVGKPRADVFADVPQAGELAGFSGYIDRSAASNELFVTTDTIRCAEPLTSAVP